MKRLGHQWRRLRRWLDGRRHTDRLDRARDDDPTARQVIQQYEREHSKPQVSRPFDRDKTLRIRLRPLTFSNKGDGHSVGSAGRSRRQVAPTRFRRPSVQISSRRRDRGMAERCLNQVDRAATIQGVIRVGVSEPVARNILVDPGTL